MKRHASIIPLSRDHHTALLCCWKIRQAVKKSAEPERIKKYIAYFFNDHLLQHFQEEENIIFGSFKSEATDTATKEHQQIAALVQKIDQHSDYDIFLNFADLLDSHIRFEERVLFPIIEQSLSEKTLSDIGEKINRLHKQVKKDNYPDNFWE